MFRKILAIGAVLTIGGLVGCNDPVKPDNHGNGGDTPQAISGTTSVFSTGGSPSDSSKFYKDYMITVGDNYPHMRFTNEAAHTGSYSITTDSNRTALQYKIDPKMEKSGICGVQFYIMTKAVDSINFSVQIGQNAGSSGGLGKAFGIGFDLRDSIKCMYLDPLDQTLQGGQLDKMCGVIQPNHWYKCNIELNFTTGKVTYSIDDAPMFEHTLPSDNDFYGIDRLLVFRGVWGGTNDNPIMCKEGPMQYYADDIVLYTK
jgi:hypothetical protein